MDNLLSNAIKYSAKGGSIKINVAQIGGSIQIDIMDFGSGVDAEDKDRIFDAFYQGRNLPQRGTVKGTGLGLAIAREYALAHGGQIQLVEQTEGTCFRSRCPPIISWQPHESRIQTYPECADSAGRAFGVYLPVASVCCTGKPTLPAAARADTGRQ